MNLRQWRSITFLVIRRPEEPLGGGTSVAPAFRERLNGTDWYANRSVPYLLATEVRRIVIPDGHVGRLAVVDTGGQSLEHRGACGG